MEAREGGGGVRVMREVEAGSEVGAKECVAVNGSRRWGRACGPVVGQALPVAAHGLDRLVVQLPEQTNSLRAPGPKTLSLTLPNLIRGLNYKKENFTLIPPTPYHTLCYFQ